MAQVCVSVCVCTPSGSRKYDTENVGRRKIMCRFNDGTVEKEYNSGCLPHCCVSASHQWFELFFFIFPHRTMIFIFTTLEQVVKNILSI